jgi:hypothetical protein
MENDITRLVVFPQIRDGDWVFRTSVSNKINIMIFAYNVVIPDSFMIRFFIDTELAKAWVEEVGAGKHLD